MNVFDNKKIIILCETHFQLFSAFTMKKNGLFDKCNYISLYLSNNINHENTMINQMVDEFDPDDVIYSSLSFGDVKHLGIEMLIKKCRLNCRNMSDDNLLKNYNNDIESIDIMLCASVSPTVMDLRFALPSSVETVLYDDGTGTHNGAVAFPLAMYDDVLQKNYLKEINGKRIVLKQYLKKIINNITLNKLKLKIKAVAMINPSGFEHSIYKIPIISVRCRDEFFSHIQLHDTQIADLYLNRQTILLTMPNNVETDYYRIETSIISKFEELGLNYIIRPHPNRSYCDACTNVDLGGNIWEILCAKQYINEQSILIGFGSSAQSHPKELFGMEPYVIFLHRLATAGLSLNASIDITYKRLRKAYNDKYKIVAPDNLDELMIFINNIYMAKP